MTQLVIFWIILGGVAAFFTVCLADYMFPFLIVRGLGMSPTYEQGETFVAFRFSKGKIDVGDVICYDSGCSYDFEINRVRKIKRVAKNGGSVRYFYCVGDNSLESYDSRHYGWIPEDSVVCRLPTRHQRVKKLVRI